MGRQNLSQYDEERMLFRIDRLAARVEDLQFIDDFGDEDPAELIGEVLAGRYELMQLIGTGGMGAVYLGRHVLIDKLVAVKVLGSAYAQRAGGVLEPRDFAALANTHIAREQYKIAMRRSLPKTSRMRRGKRLPRHGNRNASSACTPNNNRRRRRSSALKRNFIRTSPVSQRRGARGKWRMSPIAGNVWNRPQSPIDIGSGSIYSTCSTTA